MIGENYSWRKKTKDDIEAIVVALRQGFHKHFLKVHVHSCFTRGRFLTWAPKAVFCYPYKKIGSVKDKDKKNHRFSESVH